ncbi:MAG TPA: class I SAM-dependent methyltransferase, partial [Polyangiaceae bacterium]
MPEKKTSTPARPKPANRTPGKNGKHAPKLSARSADRHDLYQRSVQDPVAEIYFMQRVFKALRKRAPLTLREDFCGTALLCATWVKRSREHHATGIDLEPSVLSWGTDHNLLPLGQDAARVKLLQQDVRARSPGRFDIVCAFNFSYWVFKTRDELRNYFASVRRGLAKDGLFMLDAYGGWESHEPMLEPRKVAGGFTYVWDQDTFDPISHAVQNHIHFEFPDGTRLDKA